MKTRYSLLAMLVLGGVILTQVVISAPKGTPDDEVGLAKGSVFEVLNPDAVLLNTSEPGEEPPSAPTFEGFPPPISHGIEEYTPITLGENQCLDCHLVEEKEAGEPTPVPESHFRDLRNSPEERRAEVAGARHVCTSCHVSLTRTEPLVKNEF